MRFGVCTEIGYAPLLARSGYDFIELSVSGDLMPESDESTWTAKRNEIEGMPLPVEVFNSFVRIRKIVGPNVDREGLYAYVNRAFSRAAQVGGSLIVFGSGGARAIPDGWPAEQAHRQMIDFLNCCARVFEKTGIKVAIEPLCRAECNMINLVSEGAALAREVASPGVMNLADTYHMEAETEPLTAIIANADVLAHAHTADTGRLWPGSGGYNHTALFAALGQASYDKRLSIECSWDGGIEEHAAPALAYLKESLTRARCNEAPF